jgi:hypothetical protein
MALAYVARASCPCRASRAGFSVRLRSRWWLARARTREDARATLCAGAISDGRPQKVSRPPGAPDIPLARLHSGVRRLSSTQPPGGCEARCEPPSQRWEGGEIPPRTRRCDGQMWSGTATVPPARDGKASLRDCARPLAMRSAAQPQTDRPQPEDRPAGMGAGTCVPGLLRIRPREMGRASSRHLRYGWRGLHPLPSGNRCSCGPVPLAGTRPRSVPR